MVQLSKKSLEYTFPIFTWSNYYFQVRDPSVALRVQRSTEVIVSGMEACIPHNFFIPHAKKPWFSDACSRAIKDIEATHKRYLRSPTNHKLYISARTRAKSILRLAKNSFYQWKMLKPFQNS